MLTMCGRFTLVDLAQFTDLFPWIRAPAREQPRWNIAPSQPVLAVANDGRHQLNFFRWGLIPSWAPDPSIGNRLINARAESLAQKPAFRDAFRRRRCLIPASGFYEWRKESGGRKTPLYIRMKGAHPFAFAGLWNVWQSPDGSEIPTCVVITTEANDLVRPIHDRMPVILRPEVYQQWLSPDEKKPEDLEGLLAPYPPEEMEAYEVSRAVNNPRIDGADCVAPVRSQGLLFPPVKG